MTKQIDERNDTSAICAACGEEYDNRSGGTCGQTYHNIVNAETFSLCEHCAEDAHREEVISKDDLNSDTLFLAEFNKLQEWAKQSRISDSDQPSNDSRAERAFKAMQAYRGHEAKDEADFRDLLCDLMHYADQYGLDFDRELKIAKDNYKAE